MSHLNEVIARVDTAIEAGVISRMNELLIELSDDAALSREDRYKCSWIYRWMKLSFTFFSDKQNFNFLTVLEQNPRLVAAPGAVIRGERGPKCKSE